VRLVRTALSQRLSEGGTFQAHAAAVVGRTGQTEQSEAASPGLQRTRLQQKRFQTVAQAGILHQWGLL
jgi:hypothetical protein